MVSDHEEYTVHVRQRLTLEQRPVSGEIRPSVRFAHGTSTGMRAAEEPTVYVRGTSATAYRSSVVILGVAASLAWLAVVVICLLT